MDKQTVLAKKRRGPPATGKGVQVVVRLQPEPLGALDTWILNQADRPTRAEAIRRLVGLGLAGATPQRAKSSAGSPKPSELANTAIDHLADKSAPADEQADRKRRLLKGPEEFREARKDKTTKVKK